MATCAACRCVCGTVTDDGERMVSCDKCANWLHTRCIGLADGKEIPPDFSLTKHLRIKCCKHIRPASVDDMPKIYYCTNPTRLFAFRSGLYLGFRPTVANGDVVVVFCVIPGGMGSPRQNIGGLADHGLAEPSTSPRSGGRRGKGNRIERAAGD
jgi:hypothetical protein